MNKVVKGLWGFCAAIGLIYLHLFNTYMAYTASGVFAAIVTFIFFPISIMVWFVIVAIHNGVCAYTVAWVVTMVLSYLAIRNKKKAE